MDSTRQNPLINTIKLNLPKDKRHLAKSPELKRNFGEDKVSFNLSYLSNKTTLQKLIAFKTAKPEDPQINREQLTEEQIKLKYQTRTLPVGNLKRIYCDRSSNQKNSNTADTQANDKSLSPYLIETKSIQKAQLMQINVPRNLGKSRSGILNVLSTFENRRRNSNSPNKTETKSSIQELPRWLPNYVVKTSNTVIEFAYKEDKNRRYKNEMEDKGKSIDNFNSEKFNTLFELFDGHGSDFVAIYLQNKYHLKYKQKLLQYNNDYERALKDSFLEMDEEILKLRVEESGSTACIVHVIRTGPSNMIIYCANVGDTRCSLISPVNTQRLTYDHRATDKEEKERVKRAGGKIFIDRVEGQLMLTKAFGDLEFKNKGVIADPYISKKEIDLNEKNQFLVIACDGIWDILNEEDIQKMIMENSNSLELTNLIIKEVLAKDAWDNLSVFVVKLT